MERVTSIGGLFFLAPDPVAIGRWYEGHLGVTPPRGSYDEDPWCQEDGPTVFAPFPETTPYFGDRAQTWMVNFHSGRVSTPWPSETWSSWRLSLQPMLRWS
jgi:glyoxylase I family protein